MRDVLLISLGAALGANARYLVSAALAGSMGSFPAGTLLVNVTGSFLAGLLLGWSADRDPAWRLFLTVGFCGAYTTFSTFSVETVELLRRGELAPAAVYVFASVALCLLGVGLAHKLPI